VYGGALPSSQVRMSFPLSHPPPGELFYLSQDFSFFFRFMPGSGGRTSSVCGTRIFDLVDFPGRELLERLLGSVLPALYRRSLLTK